MRLCLLGRWALLVVAAVSLSLGGCGGGRERATATAHGAQASGAAAGPAFGLTEDDADLLWSPDAPAPAVAAPFIQARRELTALHPRYLRLAIDWATFQPSSSSPPLLSTTLDGCARGVAPCGAFAGVAGELAAIATQQRAARTAGEAGFEVVIDLYGVPAWAAAVPHGCERAGTASSARPISALGLAGYRTLIADLLRLGEEEGVELPWWSPWNEPNDPRFMSPQRAICARNGTPLAPDAYAQLAAAMASELRAAGGRHQLILGELGGYLSGSAHRLSVGEFVEGLPASVLCLGEVWAVHVYAARDGRPPGAGPVQALEEALAQRGACARSAQIWVTEVGAGAPEPGTARIAGAQEETAGCLALAEELQALDADPRVRAVFQYTFRDDPLFPVGLASSDLAHVYPVYGLWLALTRARAAGLPAKAAASACGSAQAASSSTG